MRELPENKFGFLLLGEKDNEELKGLLVKANKIASITHPDEDDKEYHPWCKSVVYINSTGDHYRVTDTVDEILEQLENIHPNLR
jgi:hypothetical protein